MYKLKVIAAKCSNTIGKQVHHNEYCVHHASFYSALLGRALLSSKDPLSTLYTHGATKTTLLFPC